MSAEGEWRPESERPALDAYQLGDHEQPVIVHQPGHAGHQDDARPVFVEEAEVVLVHLPGIRNLVEKVAVGGLQSDVHAVPGPQEVGYSREPGKTRPPSRMSGLSRCPKNHPEPSSPGFDVEGMWPTTLSGVS